VIRFTFAALMSAAYSRCPRLLICSEHRPARLQIRWFLREHQSVSGVDGAVRHFQFALLLPVRAEQRDHVR
jgi:hypothetical protein